MKNNKSPENYGFLEEFYETLWASLTEPFLNSIKTAKLKKELSSSQRQAVIKPIEKKGIENKCFIENWRPISLLNVYSKLISKTLALRLKMSWRLWSHQTKLRMSKIDLSVKLED